MNEHELKSLIAEMAGVPIDRIDAAFSLEIPTFASSIKKALLIASIRRRVGVDCMRAPFAKNFGELEEMVKQAGQFAGKPAQSHSNGSMPVVAVPQGLGLGCGVDLEMVETMPAVSDYRSDEFYRKNFTAEEIAYCAAQPEPRQHFAARWCAKEALRKCEASLAGESFDKIEVTREDLGKVSLCRLTPQGRVKLPHALSLSHTPMAAAAVVIRPLARSEGGPLKALMRLLGFRGR